VSRDLLWLLWVDGWRADGVLRIMEECVRGGGFNQGCGYEVEEAGRGGLYMGSLGLS